MLPAKSPRGSVSQLHTELGRKCWVKMKFPSGNFQPKLRGDMIGKSPLAIRCSVLRVLWQLLTGDRNRREAGRFRRVA